MGDEFLDSFTERYRHCDFLYAKNNQYKVVDLEFEKNGSPYPPIDILTFDYKKLKLEGNMKIIYNEKPCKIYLKLYLQTLSRAIILKENPICK